MEYKEIDLGLESGTLWADRNIGATSTEDGGLYFQLGDTVGYTKEQVGVDESFNWNNYKLTKYDKVGREKVLDLEDDAAHVIMGDDWRLPSKNELKELWLLPKKFVFKTRNSTSNEWGEPTDYENVEDVGVIVDNFKYYKATGNWIEEASTVKFCGIKFIGNNGNELFVPAVGCCYDGSLMYYGNKGVLWSSYVDFEGLGVWYGYFSYGGTYIVCHNTNRYYGLPMRGVKK